MCKNPKRYPIYGTDLFYDFPFGKTEFKKLIHNLTLAFSPSEALLVIELIKSIGFRTSTLASLSISLEDVKEVSMHKDIINATNTLIHSTERSSSVGQISESEKFQQSIDLWNNVTSYLRSEILTSFQGIDRLNSVYMMAFSGARGNLNQVRQLVALRGLIADPVGRVLDVPIRSNLTEGLSLTEYLISCYGSRKGVIDTAIRTAHAGYLTRRLVEVGQTILIRSQDCQTKKFIKLNPLYGTNGKILVPLYVRALGRVLADDYPSMRLSKNTLIGWRQQQKLKQAELYELAIRSPLMCENLDGICQLCYGWDLSNYELVGLGEAVGILAAQAIGEPGTQLTMRTFHTGGAFSGESSDFIIASATGRVHYTSRPQGYFVHTRWGSLALFTQTNGIITIAEDYRLDIPKSTILFVREGTLVTQGQVLGERLALNSVTDGATLIEERMIESSSDGQVVYKQHPFMNDTLYKGITVVHGFSILGQNLVCNNQQSWSSIGDRFKKSTYFTPLLYRSSCNGIVIGIQNNHSDPFISKYTSVKYNLLLSSLLIPSYRQKFKVDSRNKKIHYIFDHFNFWNLANAKYSFLSLKNIMEFNSHNFIILFTDHINIMNQVFQPPKTSLLSILYTYRCVIKCKNSLLKNQYKFKENNFFIRDCYGVVILNRHFTRLPRNILQFENIFYPYQNEFSSDEIHYVKSWVFKTRKPIARIRGWFKLSSKRMYLKPLSLTLNLKSLKTVKWCIINSSTYRVHSPEFYMEESIYDRSFSVMSRLFGFEFPLLQNDYLEYLLKSRYCFDIFVKRLYFFKARKFSTGNYTIDNLVNFFFPTIQFSVIPFQDSDVGCSTKSVGKQYKIGWHSTYSFYANQVIKIVDDTKIQSLVKYGNTVTRETPLAWMIKATKQGGEFNDYRKTLNLINFKHLVSYKIDRSNISNLPYLGSMLYEGVSYPFGHSTWNGIIFDITETAITFRKADVLTTPINEKLFVDDGDSIKKGQILTTFKVQQVSVSDITQGLPRVEKILEGRRLIRRLLTKKWQLLLTSYNYFDEVNNCNHVVNSYTDNLQKSNLLSNTPDLLFHKKLELAELVLFDIQQVVLREVQLVYKGQGVQIADKHIEIILRDLTSRIRIIECGNTNFLPGELIYPNQLRLLSNLLPSAALEGIEIMPVFIGLSGCGRGSSSFIAASSFQNTRKVLSAAVINHSSDWLRGLKSHVIIGSRIPAGTGTPFSLDIPLCSDLAQTQWYTTQIDLKSLEFNLKKRIKRM